MYLKHLLLFIVIVQSLTLWSQNKIKVKPPSDWIKIQTSALSNHKYEDSGLRYRLIDEQYNVSLKEAYYHYEKYLNSIDIVQSNSTIEIVYNPEYQDVIIHHIKVIRNGKEINKYKAGEIEVIRKESESNRSIYDKSNTILLHLTDIHKGDILSYSYTRKGFQPALKGKFSEKCITQYDVPVDKINIRVVTPSSRSIHYKLINESKPIDVITNGRQIEYLWSNIDLPAIRLENNTPYWFEPFPFITFSEWQSWSEVVDWALELYKLPVFEVNTLKLFEELTKGVDSLASLTRIIKFVQNDIRYLGLEDGEFSLKPRSPMHVLKNKYGDCKEKVQVARYLLSKFNVVSYPVLVISSGGNLLDEFLPSPTIFDHAILAFEWKNNTYYVDLTYNNQGGNALNMFVQDFNKGLLIKPSNEELTTIPLRILNEQIVSDEFKISGDGTATLSVTTFYYGSSADNIRSYFKNKTIEEINQEYEEFYSRYYPNIELKEDVFFNDYPKDSISRYYVKEVYSIDDIWELTKDGSKKVINFYPGSLIHMLEKPSNVKRTMPYQLPSLGRYNHTVFIDYFDQLDGSDQHFSIDKEYLTYSSEISMRKNSVKLEYDLNILNSYVTPTQFKDFTKTMATINADIGFNISVPEVNSSSNPIATSVSVWLICFFIVLIVGAIAGSIYIYKRYDPLPRIDFPSEPSKIQGILLFAIGSIVIGLIRYAYLLYTEIFNEYLGGITILNFIEENSTDFGSLFFYYFGIILYLSGFAFSVLLLILFVKRRSSIPRLAILYYLFGILAAAQLLVFFTFWVTLPSNIYIGAVGNLIRSLIVAGIWIPFYYHSLKVKETFTNTIRKSLVSMTIQDGNKEPNKDDSDDSLIL